jgi:hypothetical protein
MRRHATPALFIAVWRAHSCGPRRPGGGGGHRAHARMGPGLGPWRIGLAPLVRQIAQHPPAGARPGAMEGWPSRWRAVTISGTWDPAWQGEQQLRHRDSASLHADGWHRSAIITAGTIASARSVRSAAIKTPPSPTDASTWEPVRDIASRSCLALIPCGVWARPSAPGTWTRHGFCRRRCMNSCRPAIWRIVCGRPRTFRRSSAPARASRASRQIARACQDRLDVMAVAGLNRPDFCTISNFRGRHGQAGDGRPPAPRRQPSTARIFR